MSHGYDMEVTWGSVVVKLAAGDGSGRLRGGLSPGQAASYAGEMLDRIEAKVLLHHGGVGCVGGRRACGRVGGCCCDERVLVPRVVRDGCEGTSCGARPVLRLIEGSSEEGADVLYDGGSVGSVSLVSPGREGRDDELPGVRRGVGGVVADEAGFVSGGSAVEALRAGAGGVRDSLSFELESGSGDIASSDVCADVECEVVGGKWSRSNRRKKDKKKARKLGQEIARFGAGVVCEEASDGGCGVVGGVKSGVGCASVVSGGAAADVENADRVVGSGSVGESSGRSSGGVGFQREDLENATTAVERRELARQWFDRKRTENELSIQRNKYNIKRNAYLDRARISEKKWEQERLVCEQKLARITEARFGSKPGYAETLASLSDGSERPPSLSTDGSSPANLSDGTISPDSSMSVAEANKLFKKVEEVSERLVKLELENKSLRSLTVFKGGHVEEENGKFYSFDGTGQYVPPTPELGSECELYSMGDYPEYC